MILIILICHNPIFSLLISILFSTLHLRGLSNSSITAKESLEVSTRK